MGKFKKKAEANSGSNLEAANRAKARQRVSPKRAGDWAPATGGRSALQELSCNTPLQLQQNHVPQHTPFASSSAGDGTQFGQAGHRGYATPTFSTPCPALPAASPGSFFLTPVHMHAAPTRPCRGIKHDTHYERLEVRFDKSPAFESSARGQITISINGKSGFGTWSIVNGQIILYSQNCTVQTKLSQVFVDAMIKKHNYEQLRLDESDEINAGIGKELKRARVSRGLHALLRPKQMHVVFIVHQIVYR